MVIQALLMPAGSMQYCEADGCVTAGQSASCGSTSAPVVNE